MSDFNEEFAEDWVEVEETAKCARCGHTFAEHQGVLGLCEVPQCPCNDFVNPGEES